MPSLENEERAKHFMTSFQTTLDESFFDGYYTLQNAAREAFASAVIQES